MSNTKSLLQSEGDFGDNSISCLNITCLRARSNMFDSGLTIMTSTLIWNVFYCLSLGFVTLFLAQVCFLGFWAVNEYLGFLKFFGFWLQYFCFGFSNEGPKFFSVNLLFAKFQRATEMPGLTSVSHCLLRKL